MNYEITEEQIKELAELTGFESKINNKLKKMFPDVFETNTLNKWVIIADKSFSFNALVYDNGEQYTYGFNHANEWTESFNIGNVNEYFKHQKRLATDSEVEEALTNEAKKRGFLIGSYFINFHGAIQQVNDLPYLEHTYHLHVSSPYSEWLKDNCNSNPIIFKDGVWATPIKTYTKEEAEKLLNAKII